MFTGSRPFPGDVITEIAYKVVHVPPPPAREANAELPAELEAILSHCLAKKPDERYQTARELADDLEVLKARQRPAAVPLPSPSASGS